MANAFTREFETLISLIEAQYRTEDVKWPVVALLSVVEVLDDYWTAVEGGDDNPDLSAQTLDDIYETIHSVVVHQQVPMSEEQIQAIEDQEMAQLRNDIESFGKEHGIALDLQNLDQKIRDALNGNKEEKDDGD